MRSHFLNYTVVGIFVSAMVAALIVVLIHLSGRSGPTDEYSIVFDNVSDMKYGSAVRYEGYPIGEVVRIEPERKDNRYRFRIFVDVKKGWQFPKDAIARIAASSFLAAKTIEVTGGKSPELIAVGGEIPGGSPADIFSLMSSVAAEIGDLSNSSLKPMLAKISEMIDRIGHGTETNLNQLFASLNAIAKNVQDKTPEITDQLTRFTEQMNVEIAQVGRMLSDHNVDQINQTLSHIQVASANAATATSDLRSLSQQASRLADQLTQLVQNNSKNIDRSVSDLAYTLRAVSQNIDAITHNLDGTTRNMNEFSRLIRQNPGLLLSGGSPAPDSGLTPVPGVRKAP
ncbi:MAG TPA: MlaD family protein [Terriglobia bacterium]|nr:MlaD family protein [Terriglobia bacterium]